MIQRIQEWLMLVSFSLDSAPERVSSKRNPVTVAVGSPWFWSHHFLLRDDQNLILPRRLGSDHEDCCVFFVCTIKRIMRRARICQIICVLNLAHSYSSFWLVFAVDLSSYLSPEFKVRHQQRSQFKRWWRLLGRQSNPRLEYAMMIPRVPKVLAAGMMVIEV